MHHAIALLLILSFGFNFVHGAQPARRVSAHPALLPELGFSPALDLEARQTRSCDSGESRCGSSCMPSSASCCDSSEGTFCPSGYNCDGDGCCETGKRCSGSGIGCPKGSELCGLALDCVVEGTCPGKGSGSGSGTTTTSSTRIIPSSTGTAASTQSNSTSGNDGSGLLAPVGYALLTALWATSLTA
ncbi:hypothetical protein B0T18DRAFT_402117 [Schizothecium vesticola]|uniref:GPI anchored protein n=1 Tax=Schizothecium vesticola TaxID=314040 RepID=A0AA40KA19_9PEZI|nr:hypothetical protein B0T18DRAFT_402117 [Schizothecium vesticola]